MIYLLLMTMTGSILFLGYLIWTRACGSYISAGMKYRALVLVLLLHVIPLMWLKFIYNELLDLFRAPKVTSGVELLVDVADVKTATEFYRTPNYTLAIALVSVWMSFAVARLVKKCNEYYHLRKDLRSVSIAAVPDSASIIVDKIRKEFHVWRKVKVIRMHSGDSTFTIGVFRPLIVLQDHFTERELEWTLRHEMTHIARGDLLIKLLLELVSCIYWFNPILITFREHFDVVCESSCDERAVRGFTKEERAAYAKMIVCSTRRKPGVILSSALASDRENIKERVNAIMNMRKMKRWEKAIAVSLFVVLMLADSLVAFAYPNVYHYDDPVIERAEREAEGAGFWTGGDYENGYRQLVFEVMYDAEFIDETGEITPVNALQPNVFCIGHKWVSGYLQLHDKKDDGSCVVDVYFSERCTRCNTITVGDLSSYTVYPKCPH